MTPFTPTFDAFAKEFNEMRARMEFLESENAALKAISDRTGFRREGEVHIFGYTLKELSDILARWKRIEAAMSGKDFS